MTPSMAEAVRDTDCRATWQECEEAAIVLSDVIVKPLTSPNGVSGWGSVTFGERPACAIVRTDCLRDYFQIIMEAVFHQIRDVPLGAIVRIDNRYLGFYQGFRVDSTSYPAACLAFAEAVAVPREDGDDGEIIPEQQIVWVRDDLTGPISYREPKFLPGAPPPRLGTPIPRREPEPTPEPEPITEPTPPAPRTRSIFLD